LGQTLKTKWKKHFRRDITIIVEARLIFDKDKFIIEYFYFFIERIVFAICPESRPRRTDEEQRTNGLAATHVGPRIKARITDQPDAIKYVEDTPVKTYLRYSRNIVQNERYFLRLTLFTVRKNMSCDLTTDASFRYL